MNPPEPLADLIGAIDVTVKAWGWWGLALIPVAVTAVAVRQLLAVPLPAPEDVDAVWREDGMKLWEEFHREYRHG